MQTLSLITTCTNRKSVRPTRQLSARSLHRGTVSALSREWVNRISGAIPIARASELYQGRAFSEARKLAEIAGAPLYVISAGLGLVKADKRIPSYSLTVSAGTSDAIQGRCVAGAFSPDEWWRCLTRRFGVENPLSELIARSRRKLWLVAVSSSYLDLILSDLDQLKDAQLDRVRIVGPQIARSAHRVTQACLLEINDRLNGPDSTLLGTQADFAQRAARFAYDSVIKRTSYSGIEIHRRTISRRLSQWRPAERHNRQKMSDKAILTKIRRLWGKVDGQSSKMLRMLRDDEGIACEQGRFNGLFGKVKKDFV
jgi:hypothetical protein